MSRECPNCSGGIHGLCQGPSCDCGCWGSMRKPNEREVEEAFRILRKAQITSEMYEERIKSRR